MAEFKNPSQGGGGQDNRSFLLMLLVMFGIIFGLQYWHTKHNPQPPEPAPAAARQSATPSSDAPTSAAPAETAAGAPLGSAPAVAKKAAPKPAAPLATVQASQETSTVVENELYRITFSNRGGQVTSWILKGYKDSEGHPLDLVQANAAKLLGYPFSLYTYDAAMTKGLADALYVPSATGTLEAPAALSFKYALGNIQVSKTFTFGDNYVIHADTQVLRDGVPVRALLAWPAGFGDMDTVETIAGSQIDTSVDGKESHTDIKKTHGGATLTGPFDFAGVTDAYFGAIFMPDQPQDATVVTLHSQLLADFSGSSSAIMPHNQPLRPLNGPAPKGTTALPFLGAAVGNVSGHNRQRVFVGPKAMNVLKSIHAANGENLGPLLDFGFFGIIGKYLFVGLQWTHTHLTPTSWGWAIVLFTSIIYAVLMPLRVMGMKSAVKMQRIQPQIDAIKAKYKHPKPTSPKAGEMNAEVMALQKANGVSMFGGCIPSLIQLPLLYAFFTMMTRVVELRQAHWYWLPDLSAPDPWRILPVVMVFSSFLVQYYTPSPGVDPKQQRMMAFMMPLVSGYFCWNYASGLALYWNVGNLIMIGQQAVMNQTSLGREMREIALKRAARKAGLNASKAKAGALKAGAAKTIQGRR